MAFEYANQPWKGLYEAWQWILIVFFHLPSWIWLGVRMKLSRTPKGRWSLRRHLLASYFRQWGAVAYRTGLSSVKGNFLDPTNESSGVWIPPVPDHSILGIVKTRADSVGITSISVPGYWIHKGEGVAVDEPASPGAKVILFLHGGGYVGQSAHPEDETSVIPRAIIQKSSSFRRSLSVEYRLSTGLPFEPANQFPAALIDALAGYLHLVNLGFEEKNITVVGDSAGGHLSINLTLYLVDHHNKEGSIPSPPGSLVLLSPWTDVSESFRPNSDPRSSSNRFAKYDSLGSLTAPLIEYFATSFVGPKLDDREEAFRNSYISSTSPEVLGLTSTPSISFRGFPRTWIDIGGFETLLDQVRRLRDAMVRDLGEDMVRYNEVDGALHDYTVLSWNETEGAETLDKVAQWIDGGSS